MKGKTRCLASLAFISAALCILTYVVYAGPLWCFNGNIWLFAYDEHCWGTSGDPPIAYMREEGGTKFLLDTDGYVKILVTWGGGGNPTFLVGLAASNGDPIEDSLTDPVFGQYVRIDNETGDDGYFYVCIVNDGSYDEYDGWFVIYPQI